MNEFTEKVWKMIVESQILNVLWALLILFAGWILALLLKKGFRAVLKKIQLNRGLALCLPEEAPGEKRIDLESILASVMFWFVFLLTILAALTRLNLTEAAEPIRNFLNDVFGYLPNLFAGALLTFFAWVVATALKYLSLTAMAALRLDEKVEEHLDTGGQESRLSFSIASILYYLVYLCFAPAILNALKVRGITEALQNMLNQVFLYLPNLAAAGAIAFFGLFCAGLVRKIAVKCLSGLRADILPLNKDGAPVFERESLAKLAGLAVYALVAVPVVVASLSALQIDSLTGSVSGLFDKILSVTGNLFGAGVLLFAAYLAGRFLEKLTGQLLDGLGFGGFFGGLGFQKTENASAVAGRFVFFAVMLFAVIGALEILGFYELSTLMRDFVPFLGRLFLAAAVFLAGIYAANLAASAMREKGFDAALTGFAVRTVVLLFAGAVALHTANIGGPIVQTAFTLLFGAAALAAAVAFGVGGRDFAARKLDEWFPKDGKKQ